MKSPNLAGSEAPAISFTSLRRSACRVRSDNYDDLDLEIPWAAYAAVISGPGTGQAGPSAEQGRWRPGG